MTDPSKHFEPLLNSMADFSGAKARIALHGDDKKSEGNHVAADNQDGWIERYQPKYIDSDQARTSLKNK